MNAIVIHKQALSFIDMQKLENINTTDSLSTIKVIILSKFGDILKTFYIRDFELNDILEEIPSEYKMKLY